MGSRNISLLAVVWFALLVGSNAKEQDLEQERRPIKTFKFAYVELPNYLGTLYTGAKSFICNYIPRCVNGQYSASQIWILNDSDNPTYTIQAGWRVDPDLYNDDWSHLFIYWNVNGEVCFDLRCLGFVQVDQSITLGQVLPKSFEYNGPQVEIHLTIYQDGNTKDLWLLVQRDNVNVKVGYWLAKLLPQLTSSAKALQYGAATHTAQGPFPPMGSGCFLDKSYMHACVFRQIQYSNGSQTWKVPESWRGSPHASAKQCYDVALDNSDDFMGYNLLFGGPGGDGCGP